MSNLAGKPPLGQKAGKPGPKPRKALPKQSAKRRAYMASDDRKAGLVHMGKVKMLPCICCGSPPPSHAHHVTGDGKLRDDMRVLPLCYDCHQGPNGYHNAKAKWVSKYGPDYLMLDDVSRMM